MQNLTLTLRPADSRGKTDIGWLRSHHSFSFGEYHAPNHIQFGNLRVINDDIVSGGQGFGLHPHKNADIFSYVLDGALEHSDTLGNSSIVHKGGVQFMSAGSGISHSESNPSATEPMRFLQVWLLPAKQDTIPRYENLNISTNEKDGKLKLFLSHDGRNGSTRTEAHANVYCATLNNTQMITKSVTGKVWIQIAKGSLTINEQRLNQGDGVAVEGEGTLILKEGCNADFLYFELN